MPYTTKLWGPITVNKAPTELENGGSSVISKSAMNENAIIVLYQKFGFGSDVPGDEMRFSSFDLDGNNIARGVSISAQTTILPSFFQYFLFPLADGTFAYLFQVNVPLQWRYTRIDQNGVVQFTDVQIFGSAGNAVAKAELLPDGNIGMIFNSALGADASYIRINSANGTVMNTNVLSTAPTNNYSFAAHPTEDAVLCLWGEGNISDPNTDMFYSVLQRDGTIIQAPTNLSAGISDHDQEATNHNSDADPYTSGSETGFVVAWKYRNAAGQRFNGYSRIGTDGLVKTPALQLEEPTFIGAPNNIGVPRIFFDDDQGSIIIREQNSTDTVSLFSFEPSDVNDTLDEIDLSHTDQSEVPRDPFSPTNIVSFQSTGTLPGGLESAPPGGFWIADHSGSQVGIFKVFTDFNDAISNVNAVNISSQGSGEHSGDASILNRFLGYWHIDLDGVRDSNYLDLTPRVPFNEDFRLANNIIFDAAKKDPTGIAVSWSQRPKETQQLTEVIGQNINTGSTDIFLDNSGQQGISQPFTLASQKTISRVRTLSRRIGNLTGGISWQIVRDDGSGNPSLDPQDILWTFSVPAKISNTTTFEFDRDSRYFDVLPELTLTAGNYHLKVEGDSDYKAQYTTSFAILTPTFPGTSFSEYRIFNGTSWSASGTSRALSFQVFEGEREFFGKNEGKAYLGHIRFSDLQVQAAEQFTDEFAFQSLQESNKHIGFNLDSKAAFADDNQVMLVEGKPELGVFVLATDNASSNTDYGYNSSGDRMALAKFLGGSNFLAVGDQGERNKVVTNLAVGGEAIIQKGES